MNTALSDGLTTIKKIIILDSFTFAALLWVSMVLGSMCIYGAIPLFFEVVCESTYPIAEGVTNGLLTWLNNVVGLVFLFVVMIPIGRYIL